MTRPTHDSSWRGSTNRCLLSRSPKSRHDQHHRRQPWTHQPRLETLGDCSILTVGTSILPAGRWGDILGHKRMSVIGFTWFRLWFILAGLSVYVGQIFLDFRRAMQGIEPAMLLPSGIAILGTLDPPSSRTDMAFPCLGV